MGARDRIVRGEMLRARLQLAVTRVDEVVLWLRRESMDDEAERFTRLRDELVREGGKAVARVERVGLRVVGTAAVGRALEPDETGRRRR